MATNQTKKHDVSELISLYSASESIDQEVFAEQRSGILLIAGEHYNRRRLNVYKRIRDSKELTNEQKLRLTKNHIQKIHKTYVNNILSMAPDVGFMPKNESELQDQKAAELHHAVWLDAKEKYSIDELKDDWADSFVGTGEVAVKIFYDPFGGKLKAYNQAVDDEGNPIVDKFGQPAPDLASAVHEGAFVFEEIYGFNLFRPVECKDMRQAEWLGLRKMVDREKLLAQFGGTEENDKIFATGQDETFLVFDGAKGGYSKADKQVLVLEFFFKPCAQYPNGYFFYLTKNGIFAEGELPGGIFPIVYQAFDKIPTTPRGIGPVKTMRPYQAEINRASSKIAEHQITLGDDKLILNNGSKVSSGANLPGIRTVYVQGGQPMIMEGRAGNQFLEYVNAQIQELYDVMMVSEDSKEIAGNIDPYVLLFRSAKQKKRFQRYVKRFEKFLINVVKTYLQLAKLHLSDDAVIYAVGRSEQVNIPEFRSMTDLCYEIRVEAQSDDIDTKLGKQMVLNTALQYVGSQLKPEDIGKFLRLMPFANFDGSFDDLTIDHDSATNDILALDRGERPPINEYDNHIHHIKSLTARMRKADFKNLSPVIQSNYQAKLDAHQQMEAFNQARLQRAKDGFIPTGGYMVVCDLYAPDPKDPLKTKRVRVPYEALQWLIKQLELQGMSQDAIEGMPQGAQAQIADKVVEGRNPQNQPAPGAEGMVPPAGVGAAEMAHGDPNENRRTERQPGNFADAIRAYLAKRGPTSGADAPGAR